MRRTVSLLSSVVIGLVIAALGGPHVAYAQAVDAFNPGANQTVWTVAVQADGKTVFGGVFTGLGGGTGATAHNHIGRLNVDGSVDEGFVAGANADVYAVAVQPDGKILVGGNFTTLGVSTGITARNRIGRFNSDGTVDTSFNPGANLPVYALAVQPDGKILVGGAFSTLGGSTRLGLGRLNANGSLDSFNPGTSKIVGAPIVYALALQTNGSIVVGGYFNGLGGGTGATARNFIGRLTPDGVVDAFNPGANSISGVNALALQADGKVVVGGSFTGLGGGTGTTPRGNIGRLSPDGTVDMGFNPGAEAQVLTLAVQADGKILAGGYFQLLGGGATRKYIGRLTPEGAIDSAFNPGAQNVVSALAIQSDGAIVVGGIFSALGGGTGVATPRLRIGRITNTAPAVQNLALSSGNTVVTWTRSGSGPEVSGVTFEMSTNGSVYSLLGSASRVAGGWELSGQSVPQHQTVFIRARGYYSTGYQTGSGSIVESIVTSGQTTRGDFDGDGNADVTIYRPSTGQWYVLNSGGSTYTALNWGASGDMPMPADYDGDGKTDAAIYRPSSGTWWILQSSTNFSTTVSYSWGISTDTPVPADYDGDGKADIAIYRASTGTWWILKSSTGYTAYAANWGTPGDLPVTGDYDGDGKSEIALFRPATGVWWILYSSSNYTTFSGTTFGVSGDLTVPADYDGDGKTDIALYRNGAWYVLRSSDATFYAVQWGISTDIPVPADYDGDGLADIAVYRPSAGSWFIQRSSGGVSIQSWGTTGDVPVLGRQ